MSDYSVFTSESVSEGHPDKMADQISDAILDAMLRQDPESRVAVETLIKTGLVVVAGEVRSNAEVDVDRLVRKVIADIGCCHGFAHSGGGPGNGIATKICGHAVHTVSALQTWDNTNSVSALCRRYAGANTADKELT